VTLSKVERSLIAIGLLFAPLCVGACGRAAISALSKEQDRYYASLSDLFEKQKDEFDAAIDSQLQADAARRRQVLEWNRDLAKADVLLQSGATPKGKKELLFTKTAELDIEYQKQFATLDEVERERAKALKDLYAALEQATLAAQKNNHALTSYLAEGSTEFALQSFDAAGAAAAASTVEARVGQLRGAAEKTAQARKAEQEKTQQQIDNVRNVLVKVLERQNGQH
jgi:hypothetical protein